MKNILTIVAATILGAFRKILGKSNKVAVNVPDIAITEDTLNHVIDVVNNIKLAVTNPLTIALTDLIPGTLDNTIRLLIEKAIVPVLAGLTFSKGWIKNYYATGDLKAEAILLNDLLNKIRFADDPDKDALYHTVAARLIVAASDGKVTWSEAVTIVEPYFKQVFKG